MFTNIHFVLLALHRRFVSLSSSSRSKAYYFTTQILEFQTRLFDCTEPLQHRSFKLVFPTLDATILIAAMHIRFPDEFADQYPAAKRNLEWALDRLKPLEPTNDQACSAFYVIQQLYQKCRLASTLLALFHSHVKVRRLEYLRSRNLKCSNLTGTPFYSLSIPRFQRAHFTRQFAMAPSDSHQGIKRSFLEKETIRRLGCYANFSLWKCFNLQYAKSHPVDFVQQHTTMSDGSLACILNDLSSLYKGRTMLDQRLSEAWKQNCRKLHKDSEMFTEYPQCQKADAFLLSVLYLQSAPTRRPSFR